MDDFEEAFGIDESCYHCGGRRYVIVCFVDLCHGTDRCIHGDGEADCPVCNKDGQHEWELH